MFSQGKFFLHLRKIIESMYIEDLNGSNTNIKYNILPRYFLNKIVFRKAVELVSEAFKDPALCKSN